LEETMKCHGTCEVGTGSLPGCAMLARAYVPMQQCASPVYDKYKAIVRGTLFPELDLPFMNMVNKQDMKPTPLGEVMAVDFVLQELQLYLDTHENDADAFAAYKGFLKLSKEAHRRYVELYGPICRKDMADCPRFSWLDGAWPWELRGEKE